MVLAGPFLDATMVERVRAINIFPIPPTLMRAVGSSGSGDLLGKPMPSGTDHRLLGGERLTKRGL